MTLADFKLLDADRQKQIVADTGVLVSVLQWEGYRIFLFQLESFYVEYFFDSEKGELAWTTAFDNIELLDKYLEQIDISKLRF